MRLIDADSVMRKINYICKLCGNEEKYDGIMCRPCYLDDAKSYVEDEPTINAIPVEWIKSKIALHKFYMANAKARILEDMIKDWRKENELD